MTSGVFADQFARRYAGVKIRSERLVVTDRGVTTTAASSATYDFALGFIREHHGPLVARSTARSLLTLGLLRLLTSIPHRFRLSAASSPSA